MKTSSMIYRSLFFMSVLSLLFVAVSCKDDDDKEPEPTEEHAFVGDWKFTSLTQADGSEFPGIEQLETAAPCMYDLVFEFKQDFTLNGKNCAEAIVFLNQYFPIGAGAKWETKDNKLTISRATDSKEFAYTTGKDASDKDQLSFVVPVTVSGIGEVNAKLTFVKQ